MPNRYSLLQQSLHWIMAALMIAGFILGEVMSDMPRGDAKTAAIGWHVLIGLSMAVLLVPRFFARLGGVPAPLPGPAWQEKLAKLAHHALYAVMLVLPVTGLVSIFAASRPRQVLGLFEVPSLFPNGALHEGMEGVHEATAKIFLLLLVVHVLAVVWHSLVRRDSTLARMLPWHR